MTLSRPINPALAASVAGALGPDGLPWDRALGAAAAAALTPPTQNLVTWHRPEGIDLATPLWRDDGSDATDLVQVAASPPTAGVSIDGRATMDAGGQTALQQAVTSLAQPFTVYAVFRLNTLISTSLLFDGATGSNRVTAFNNGTADPAILVTNAGTNLSTTGQLRRNTVHALRFTANGASSAAYVTDLQTPAGSGNAGAGSWGGLTLGGRYTFGNAWPGDIAELLRYSGDHDAAAVEAYLLAKYPSAGKRTWATYDVQCAGDSITVGVGSTDGRGYRSILREDFEPAASDIESGVRTLRFVGATNDACMDHSGVSGNSIAQVNARIAAEIAAQSPDLLVLLAGTNDCRNNGTTYDTVTTPADYATLLATIYAADNALPVVACLVPPLTNATHDANVTELNGNLQSTVFPAADSDITVCDLNSILTPASHLSDGVHPNDAGYALVESAIAASIRAVA